MEREIVRSTEKFHDVTFTNFPGYKDPDTGEVTQKLLEGVMCEDIALQIPPKLRNSVSVDFQSLAYDELLEETKAKHGLERAMTDDQMQAVEDLLIQAIFTKTEE